MKCIQRYCLVAGMTVLFAASSFAQTWPTLQISGSGGNAAFSWSGASGVFLLQTTTNLSRPITWTNALPNPIGAPATNVNVMLSHMPQFFRLAQAAPVFQFAIFYNLNLEMDPGAGMAINGPVFSNQGIWAGTPDVTFNSTVAAVGLVYDDATNPTGADPWCSGKVDYGTPLSNFLYPPASHQGPLILPIGTNNNPNGMKAIINLVTNGMGAPNVQAYSTSGQVYLFNESDLIISNAPYGTNITIWFQDPNNALGNYLTKLNPDVTNHVGTVTNKSFSFVTNVSYYDYRESDTVLAVQIDVAKLSVWLTNTAGGYSINKTSFHDNGHGIQSIYVYNNVLLNSSQLPAVRLVNGAQLPHTIDPNGTGATTSGLTVTTPQPLYVLGNYNVQTNGGVALASAGTTNTANTYPAALMADAITILSANWSDSYTASTPLSSRLAAPTTLNAAALEGIVQSTNSNYSGGAENFLRMEEDWSVVVLQYNGSIVVMFPSQYAINPWPGTGSGPNVYNPPTRHWGFDYNFTDVTKLPALTPMVVNYVTP